MERSDIISTASTGYVLDSTFGDNGFLIGAGNLQVQLSAVPEPGYALVILGFFGLIFRAVRRKMPAAKKTTCECCRLADEVPLERLVSSPALRLGLKD